MINFLLIIFLAILKSSDAESAADPTIIAEPGKFSYYVMVWNHDKFCCGGIIIDQRHIITRASCVVGIPSFNLSIIAGTIDTKVSKAQPLHVESVHIHHGFEAINDVVTNGEIRWVHDIAVLKLVNELTWDSRTGPAVLITGEFNWNFTREYVVPAWRHTRVDTVSPRYYIRWIQANSIIDKYCFQSFVPLLKNEKCASWGIIRREWKSTIHYYRGSPIVYENTVIGIADGLADGWFHAFLNLLPYKDFIEYATDDRKYDVNPGDINYVVSVWHRSNFKCGGIILDASHILTTGDCVQYANTTNLHVVAGHTLVIKYDSQIQWLSVDNIEIHPDYEEIIHFDGPKFMHVKNNYAILTLAVALEYGATIGPAFLATTHFVLTNPVCGAYRWHNAYTVDDKVLLQLIQSPLIIMNAEDCQAAGVELEADEICVGSQYAPHRRNLDSSGNPVVCDRFVIGIIIPDYSTVPQFSCLTTILHISTFVNSLNDACYKPPIH